jgi:hypothetical protein
VGTCVVLPSAGFLLASGPVDQLRKPPRKRGKLSSANLQGANLIGAHLEETRCNADTVLPTGFDCEDGKVKFQRS